MAPPNILLLFSDQHRGDWLPFSDTQFEALGMEPLDLKMEHIRELMKNGTVFTNAVTTSPLCVPARACLASGLQYHNCGIWNNDFCFPIKDQTFYKVLKNGGYQVAGVGKFDLHKPILYWNKDGWLDQLAELGFTDAIDSEGKYDLLWSSFYESKGPYSNFLRENGLFDVHAKDYMLRYFDTCDADETPLPEYAYADNWVTSNAKDMMNQLMKQSDPWFMMVNFSGPHNPWDITKEMKEGCKDLNFPPPRGCSGDLERINQVRQNYSAMIENIDKNIGNLVSMLKETGQYENTVIIYSSDHGEMLGDKGRFFKSVPYRGAVRIPMIISGAGVAKDRICGNKVQLHDLASTILDFAEMKFPIETDSISLKPLAQGRTDEEIRDYQIIMLHNSVRHEGSYEDYKDYMIHQKKGTDFDYIEEFNKKYHLPIKDSVKKYDYNKDWECIISENYKLVMFADETFELYDLKADPFELENIASDAQDVVERLKNKYRNIISNP